MAGIRELVPAGPVIGLSTPDFSPFVLGDYILPPDTKYSIAQAKNYTSTQVGKRNIKEVSGHLPWQVTIEFTIVRTMYNGVEIMGVPIPGLSTLTSAIQEDIIGELKKITLFWKQESAIPVEQETLNELDIFFLFVHRIEFPDPDVEWELPIRMQCESDDGENAGEGISAAEKVLGILKGIGGVS